MVFRENAKITAVSRTNSLILLSVVVFSCIFFVFNRYFLPPQRLKINFSKAKVCSGYLSGLGAELTSMAGGVASIVLLVIQSG